MLYNEAILGSYLYVRASELGEARIASLRERLTFVPRGTDAAGKPVALFEERNGLFGLPLYDSHLSPSLQAIATRDLRTTGTTFQFDFKPELREGQKPVISTLEKWLKEGATGFLLEAEPGFGKTVVLLKIMQLLGCTTLVVVPRSNLIKQWVERITEHTSLKRSEIGVVNGPQAVWRGKKVVVGLVHTLALDRLPKEFKTMFGAAFFDEVDHSVPPQTFGPVVTLCPVKYRVGCSAEMKRFDGRHVVFEKHIGQVRLQGVAHEDEVMQPKVLAVEFDRNSGKVYSGLSSMQRRGVLLSMLAKNPARNMMISKYVKLMYNSDRQLVVLSDRVEHLVTLRGMATKAQGIPLSETGLYAGSVPAGEDLEKWRKPSGQELSQIASDCKVIFATYQMFALGTDIQNLAGLIYATPQSGVVQSKGRIVRALADKKQPVVVDVLDTMYPDTMRWWSKRLKHYRDEGMQVKRVRG